MSTAAEVCFDELGCFDDLPPWGGTSQRPASVLPWHYEEIGTRFLLFTQKNRYYQVGENLVFFHCLVTVHLHYRTLGNLLQQSHSPLTHSPSCAEIQTNLSNSQMSLPQLKDGLCGKYVEMFMVSVAPISNILMVNYMMRIEMDQ